MIHKYELPEVNLMSGHMNLIFRARMLWRDMATWLTIYLFSLYGGYANQQALADQLYSIPLDYGNVMKLIFGDRVSEDYINLVSNYVITLENLFQAQRNGDQNAVNTYFQQLYQNIDQRAAYLAQINPYWQAEVWRTLLYNYNNMILEDSITLLAGDYVKNVDVVKRLFIQSSIIGDYFSEGIFNYMTGTQAKSAKRI